MKKKNNQIILALDTSTYNISISLYKKEMFFTKSIISTDHSESIFELVNKILKISKTDIQDLTHIAVNIGPGSFTGLRIGLSFVKILAKHLKLKIITTNSFNILVYEFINKFLKKNKIKNYEVYTIFPSLKEEVYFCKFLINHIIKQKTKYSYLNTDKLKKFFKKNKFIIAPNFLNINSKIIKVKFSSESIIKLFLQKNYSNLYKIVAPKNLYPLYIRKTYY